MRTAFERDRNIIQYVKYTQSKTGGRSRLLLECYRIIAKFKVGK
jgi:hypothetical protein